MAANAKEAPAADPAVALLYRYAAALDRMALNEVPKLFDSPARYRVQCRRNFERNGVLHLVNDSEKDLRFRISSHPIGRLETTVHVLGQPSVQSRRDGECSLSATFAIDRAGVPTFSGEYRATINERGDSPLFKELIVILEGESAAGSIQVPI